MWPPDRQQHVRLVRAIAALTGVLLLLLGVSLSVAAAAADLEFPALSGRVVDEAQVLSPAERASLTAKLEEHEQRTGQQLVVVTLSSLRGQTIEDYGYQLGRHWGIGEKDKNTGVLFIIAPKERKVRIEVGYGLEGGLTDAASRLILENIVLPAFRNGQMGPGIVAGTDAILDMISGEAPASPPPSKKPRKSDEISPLTIFFIFLAFLFVLYALRRNARSMPGGPGALSGPGGLRRRSRRGGYLGGLGGGLGGLGGGMGGGWGGGDGGGFSGGGGSFGGGGASGDW